MVVAIASVAATPYRETSARNDKIDGVWRMMCLDYQGEKWVTSDSPFPRWHIQGANVRIENGPGVEERMTVKWQTARKPAALDVIDSGTTTIRAIYQINGDQLIICAGTESRPTDFTPRADKNEWRVVLVRE